MDDKFSRRISQLSSVPEAWPIAMGSWKASTGKTHHRETAPLLYTWEEGWLMQAVFKISVAQYSGLTLTDIYSPLRKSHISPLDFNFAGLNKLEFQASFQSLSNPSSIAEAL